MYLGFSQWFGHNKLRGSEKWCLDHSEVERQDAIKIFDHLANRRIEEEEESSGTGAQPLQVSCIYAFEYCVLDMTAEAVMLEGGHCDGTVALAD